MQQAQKRKMQSSEQERWKIVCFKHGGHSLIVEKKNVVETSILTSTIQNNKHSNIKSTRSLGFIFIRRQICAKNQKPKTTTKTEYKIKKKKTKSICPVFSEFFYKYPLYSNCH